MAFKNTVTIGKATFRGAKFIAFAYLPVPNLYPTNKALDLDPIGTYILDWCSPHRTWDEGQVLEPIPTLRQTKTHKIMPCLTRLDLYDCAVSFIFDMTDAARTNRNNQGIDLLFKHNIAAPREHMHMLILAP